jgi:pimeloyl-ACP methyl ester carboxylesterase
MDYRYPHRIVDVRDELDLSGKYDHFVLVGASLGALVASWLDVLIKHIEAALLLKHHIKKIVILDHRDCGAYRHPKEIGVPCQDS